MSFILLRGVLWNLTEYKGRKPLPRDLICIRFEDLTLSNQNWNVKIIESPLKVILISQLLSVMFVKHLQSVAGVDGNSCFWGSFKTHFINSNIMSNSSVFANRHVGWHISWWDSSSASCILTKWSMKVQIMAIWKSKWSKIEKVNIFLN